MSTGYGARLPPAERATKETSSGNTPGKTAPSPALRDITGVCKRRRRDMRFFVIICDTQVSQIRGIKETVSVDDAAVPGPWWGTLTSYDD